MSETARHFDCIVVGGGSAGCALAARLSEDPRRSVLLVEAGPDFNVFPEILLGRNEQTVEDQYTWKYESQLTADPASMGSVVRGRVMGGSSSVNGGVFLRGLPEDFELWTSPLWTWDQVLRCYKRSETDHDFSNDLHGSSGPIPVHRVPRAQWTALFEAFYRACCDADLGEAPDQNDPNQSGVGPIPRNFYGGIRVNAAMGYIEPARGRTNLTIVGSALVSRVLFDRRRAVGVEILGQSGTSLAHSDLVILSAGAIETPLILMRSGIGPAVQLERIGVAILQDMPGVGANLQDHPVVKLELQPRIDRPLLGPNDPGRFQSQLIYSSGTAYRHDLIVMPAYFPDSIVLAPSLIFGLASGLVEIVSADPQESPRIQYNYFEDPIDLDRIVDGVILTIELANGQAMREVAGDLISPTKGERVSRTSLERWLRKNMGTSFHSSGTCRMGKPNDNLAVLDDHCRVRAIDNLVVADLSIMPRTIRANTNATAIMIGERVAELLTASTS